MKDFYDLGDSCLAAASAGLTSAGLSLPPSVFVAHGRPPDDCGNLLAVYLERARPSVEFPRAATGAEACGQVSYMFDVVVRIVRDTAPGPTDNQHDPFPPASVMDAHAAATFADVAAVACGLHKAHQEGALVPWIDDGVAWGVVSPYGPAGLVAGWDIRFTVEG